MLNKDDGNVKLYTEKSIEYLMEIEGQLTVVHWYQNGIDDELINKILMNVRYIRDRANIMGLIDVESLAHAIETRANLMRKGKRIPISRTISIMLLAAHELREVLMSNVTTNEMLPSEFSSTFMTSRGAEPIPAKSRSIDNFIAIFFVKSNG